MFKLDKSIFHLLSSGIHKIVRECFIGVSEFPSNGCFFVEPRTILEI